MSDDTKSPDNNANSGKPSPISEAFNRDNELAEQVARLSPEAQEKCRTIRQLSAERLEGERRGQQRSHSFRVLKTKVELLENYIRDTTTERPPEMRADPTPDLEIMSAQAERMVKEKEAYFLDRIQREAEANIRHVVASERRETDFRRNDAQHDHESER